MDDDAKVIEFPKRDEVAAPVVELPLTVLKLALRAAQPLASPEKIDADYEAFKDRMQAAMVRVVEYRDRQWDRAIDEKLPTQKNVIRLALPGKPH